MGYQGAVKSPTFTLVEPYQFEEGQVFHFDLYRLNDSDELEYIGIDDYFNDRNLCLVEWPEKAKDSLPAADLDVKLSIMGKSRCIDITPNSDFGSVVLENLKQRLSGYRS
jgi:tRNA threonylcarbamoyladenosine biosynthesis protein TsaE